MRRPVIAAILACVLAFSQSLFHFSVKAQSMEPPPPAKGSLPPTLLPVPLEAFNGLAPSPNLASIDADPYAAWSQVAYANVVDGSWDVFVAQADGSRPINLTRHPSADFNPNLRKDRQSVVFDSDRSGHRQVYAIGVVDRKLANLSNNENEEYDPEWSPDGQWVALVSGEDHDAELYLVSPTTGERLQCTQDKAYDRHPDLFPTWSPDGRYIYWIHYSSHWIEQDQSYWAGEVWRMNPDCTQPVNVMGGYFYRELMGPIFISPDGTQALISYGYPRGDFQDLAVLYLESRQYQELYASFNYDDMRAGGWSPDGKVVLFSHIVWGDRVKTRLNAVYAERLDLVTGADQKWSRLAISGYALMHDWKSMDEWPPVTELAPLPAFLPAIGIHLSWSGADVGPAGIEQYYLQTWRSGLGTWQSLDYYSPLLAPIFASVNSAWYLASPETAGDVVRFRSRAQDVAGHLGKWTAGTEIAQTTLYAAQISGRVTDVRGVGLARLPIGVTPAPLAPSVTTAAGGYSAYLKAAQPSSLSENQPRSLPATQFSMNAGNAAIDRYLLPPDDRLQNGGFESGLSGWEASGGSAMAAAVDIAHSGAQALQLGVPCDEPCLDAGERLPRGFEEMAVAPDGVQYFIEVEISSDVNANVIKCWSKTPAGVWSGPETVAYVEQNNNIPFTDLISDPSGGLHLLYRSTGRSYYTYKPVGGSWEAMTLVNYSGVAGMAVTPDGAAHLAYASSDGVSYRTRTPDGTWPAQEALVKSGHVKGVDIASAADGSLHVIYSLGEDILKNYMDENAYELKRTPDRIWQPAVMVNHQAMYQQVTFNALSGWDGGAHVFYPGVRAFNSSTAQAGWSVPLSLDSGYYTVASDDVGRLHVLRLGWYYDSPSEYRIQDRSGWQVYPYVTPLVHTAGEMAFGVQGEIHILDPWPAPDPVLRSRQTAQQEAFAELSQQVTIPESSHRATLTFAYQGMVIGAPGGAKFEALVIDGTEETVVFTGARTPGWELAWADLSPWKGKIVKVAFRLTQPQGAYLGRVLLDSVSLGSWNTPLPQSVEPARFVTDWQGKTVVIHGENFIPGARVLFGSTWAPSVRYVDDTTLEAVIPVGLLSGWLDLAVVNPGDAAMFLSRALRLGSFLNLPVLIR